MHHWLLSSSFCAYFSTCTNKHSNSTKCYSISMAREREREEAVECFEWDKWVWNLVSIGLKSARRHTFAIHIRTHLYILCVSATFPLTQNRLNASASINLNFWCDHKMSFSGEDKTMDSCNDNNNNHKRHSCNEQQSLWWMRPNHALQMNRFILFQSDDEVAKMSSLSHGKL